MSITQRFTSADLEGLPDFDNARYEIVDGELFVSRMPHWQHQHVCGEVGACLREANRRSGNGWVILAPGVIFAEDDDVAPDVVWISRERLASSTDAAGHLLVAPELVVEVLSRGAKNERRDRDLKLKLYSRQGVHEYWLVDWRQRTVQVYRRADAALHLVATLDGDDVLTTPLLPELACPISELWAAP